MWRAWSRAAALSAKAATIRIVFPDHGSVRIAPGEEILLDMARPCRIVNEGKDDHVIAILPCESPSSAEQVRRQVRAFIDVHLRDPDLAIDDIASALGLSKRYLHMCFAAEGASIADYLWQARLEQSRRELERDAGSGRTVTDIAFACGFNSSSHFSRLFKARFGQPPSRLRN